MERFVVLLREKTPGLQIELIDTAGQLLMWDARERFLRTLLGFLPA